MALDTGNYLSDFDNQNPTATDPVSEGDDVLRFIKTILQRTFPAGTAAYDGSTTYTGLGPDRPAQVLIAKSTAPTVDTSASGNAARAMGLLWLDTGNNLLKIRNQANDAWITLAIDPETSNSVDINAGAIDGTPIGANSASTGAFSTVTTTGALTVGTDITISGDDIIMATNTDAYLLVADGTSYNPVAISGDVTITNAGVTSIGADKVITVKILDANVTNAKLANMAANTVKVRDANSSGVPSDKALATTEILIGDGTGFTAAALSGDATMTNAGAVTVAKIRGETVSTATVADDQYLKYSSDSSEWQFVTVIGDDKLTTKGDLLAYNTVDSETRFPVGANNKLLVAASGEDEGFLWQYVDGESIRMSSDAQGDILYFDGTDYARLGYGTSGDVLTTGGSSANPAWATPTTGDITSVVAGSGLTGGATSGAATLTVGAGTGITVNTSDIQVSTSYAGGSSIATVGTVGTGTWQGTAVALAYIGSGVGKLATGAEWTATQNFNSTSLVFDATQDWDTAANQVCDLTLTANTTFDAPSNQVDGGFYSITLKQDGTGGWTGSWNAVFHFAAGTAPTLTTTASAVDILVFRSDGTNMLEVGRQLDVKTA